MESSLPERPLTEEELKTKKTHTLANLRQAIWEAHQYMSPYDLEDYCTDVVAEIDSDNQEG